MRIRVEMVEKTQFEHITLFWQFVPSLSPRITGSPVRREGCSEPTPNRHIQDKSCLWITTRQVGASSLDPVLFSPWTTYAQKQPSTHSEVCAIFPILSAGKESCCNKSSQGRRGQSDCPLTSPGSPWFSPSPVMGFRKVPSDWARIPLKRCTSYMTRNS
jgi:hypothetical protein